MAPKKVDKHARRREILEAAARVFATRGYRQATIDQIAEAAGISKGTVYLSFASKEDLFYELFEQLTRDAMQPPTPSGDIDPPTAKARIAALFHGVMDAVDANEGLIPLTMEFWSACGVEETRLRFGARYAELFGAFRTQLAGMIRDGMRAGEFRQDLPVEATASCLMAIIDGLLLQQWTDARVRASHMLRDALPPLLGALDAKG